MGAVFPQTFQFRVQKQVLVSFPQMVELLYFTSLFFGLILH